MLMKSRLLLVLSILLAPDVTHAQTSFDTAQLAVELTKVQQANLQILRMYEWTMRTEVVLPDGSKAVQLEKVSFTEDGERTKKLIGSSSIRDNPRLRTLVPKVRRLAAQYTEPSTGALVDFFAKAKFTPGKGSMARTVKVLGKSFLQTGDAAVVWFDPELMGPRKYKFRCRLDGSRVDGEANFKTHPEGFFYMEQIVVKIPDEDVLTTIRNYDLVNRTPPEQHKAEEESDEEGWPREYAEGDAKVVIFQPQLDGWKDYRKLEATVAFSVEWAGQEPAFGVVHMAARTETNFSSRTVLIMDRKLGQLHFSDLEGARQKKAESTLRSLLPNKPIPYSLDRILAGIEKDEAQQKNTELSFAPPRILVSESPAVLLMVSGEPVLETFAGTDLKQVLNTDWDLLWHDGSSQYYLAVENSWLQASTLDGSWALCRELPESFEKIPEEPHTASLRKRVKGSRSQKSSEAIPKVYHSSEAAELIVIDGEPLFEPIANTRLLEVSNTDSDLFLHMGDSEYYFLVGGRWFRSGTLEGPWAFASHDLPKDFSKISPGHARAGVLVSVPGTPAAREARLLAQIPRTATVERHSPEVEVTYDGDPEFEEISETSLEYATNTTFDVIRADDGKSYLCHEGVWFVSDSPEGPWSVCVEVPEEIYGIPSSSSKYHVTYVKVYDYDDDSATTGYTGGYLGAYTDGDYDDGVVYYGTGYYYAYPYGYWRHYNRYRHRYRGWRRPYRYGTYGRGAVYSAHRAGFHAGRHYSRYHASRARAQSGGSVYSSWGSKGVRANQRVAQRSAASGGRVVNNSRRNVYAGKDGGVYRKQNGRWQQRQGNRWNDVSSPTAKASRPGTSGQGTRERAESRQQREVQKRLDRDARNRKTGSQRVSQHRSSSSRSRGAARSQGGRRGGRR